MRSQRVSLPAVPALIGRVGGNELRQWVRGPVRELQSVGQYRSGGVAGLLLTSEAGQQTLVVPTDHAPTMPVDSILICPKPEQVLDAVEAHLLDPRVRWTKPAPQAVPAGDFARIQQASDEARASWQDQFAYREERVDSGGAVVSAGLRPPQIGAIHAAIGHWRAQNEPATVVMPTGTGKTETMLALLVAEQIPRLFVVVPTDALRQQIADKFLSLGLLPALGVTSSRTKLPVVATLSENMASPADVDQIVTAANVIITTAALIATCSAEAQERIAHHCSHLFIDEAHHVPAKSWYAFRGNFRDKRILQFTATPFRRDGQLVDGRQIFAYPLRKAQADGYFRPLKFVPLDIFPVTAGHRAIADAALRQLNEDLAAGLDHLIMARVDSISRAQTLLEIYEAAGAPNPVLVHSKLPGRKLAKCVAALRTRQSRVAICVDMFGEGFDMPQLKIAALHDVHKSLATTLQFIGRFTRSAHNVGNATLIVNLGDVRVEGALRELYQEDSDWNRLLPGITERTTRRHRERSDFIKSFKDVPPEVPLLGIEPKMSALVYRTACADWTPERATVSLSDAIPCIGPVINTPRTVALYITRETYPVDWGRVASPADTVYHLYLAYWDQARQLLFINTSNHDGAPESFAQDVSRRTAQLIQGEAVFRALKGLNRLSLMNLGLKHTLNRATRFTMFVGTDIIQGLTDASQQNRVKTNLFGKGYENGERATVGCSLKGRIWSHRVAEDISEWIEWCNRLGTKLLDNSISTEAIFKNVIMPTTPDVRPLGFPVSIEWPDEFILRHDLSLEIEVDAARTPFFDTELEIESPSETAPLRFAVTVAQRRASYEILFSPTGVEFVHHKGPRAFVHFERRGRLPIEQVFAREAPIVRFATGAWLDGPWLYPGPAITPEPFRRDRIQAWDWTGIDLTHESQGPSKASQSIQFRTLERLKAHVLGCEYDLLIDDDGSNEVADIVGLKVTPEGELIIHLIHCKFSKETTPGARIEDLYAVCGQAQKSVNWRSNIERMLDMLITRDAARTARTGVSGIEVGNVKLLRQILRQAHLMVPKLAVWVVQPGLSKVVATTNQLLLLAVTELYLSETFAAPFGVIASA